MQEECWESLVEVAKEDGVSSMELEGYLISFL